MGETGKVRKGREKGAALRPFIGVASYSRPETFRLLVKSIIGGSVVAGIIAVIDAPSEAQKTKYIEVIKEARRSGVEVLVDISSGRRGSTNARNRVLDIAEEVLGTQDYLVLCDDDYVCPEPRALLRPRAWLSRHSIGLVGGRVVNLRMRRVDPDFNLNILPGLADALSKLTGFVFLDTRHGPRFTDYTTPLMALRPDVVRKGVRYDPDYRGTSYREETDFQEQVRKHGYRIVFDPGFYAYHLCVEEGGNRVLGGIEERFYWKARNHVYYLLKHRAGFFKLLAGTSILSAYSLLHGLSALRAVKRGVHDAYRTVFEKTGTREEGSWRGK